MQKKIAVGGVSIRNIAISICSILKRMAAKNSGNVRLGSIRRESDYALGFAEKKPPARQVVYEQEKIQS
ncbi:hypothetical protein [Citrobacter werkmanii]|uniref:hypothetical protein n=1 Tax=Citrobacter werkmanii TaxID=67827 RepID=UPI001D0AB721|nr:hypothetical protein [Citrobacter werkmanii]MBY6247525.1 hypothetical protein [Citrobacter werkmanii]